MRSATLKALAIGTALEAGPADGPDYVFGWGSIRIQDTVDFMRSDQFVQETVDRLARELFPQMAAEAIERELNLIKKRLSEPD